MPTLGKIRNHPRWLEVLYILFDRAFKWFDPLIRKIGYQNVDRWVYWPEKISKESIFDCVMCGQCTLHNTGMTCPMTCPKNLRNGPCGGVGIDKSCEVDPGMICVWVEAYERSTKMKVFGDGIHSIQPPLNHRVGDKSAFINVLCCEGDRMPLSWEMLQGSEKLSE